jgi:hypothetical protein
MKKLTYILLLAFIAGLGASTWTANASETSGKHLIQAGNKAAVHQAKAKKAEKKNKKKNKQHKKKHGKKAKT